MNNFHQSKVCWQEARGVSEISSYFRIVCKHRHLCIFAPQCYIVWLQMGVLSLLFWQNVQKCLLVDSFSMTLQDRYILMFLTDLSFSVYKWVLAAAGGKWVWKSWELIGTKHWIPNQVGLHCIVCNHERDQLDRMAKCVGGQVSSCSDDPSLWWTRGSSPTNTQPLIHKGTENDSQEDL